MKRIIIFLCFFAAVISYANAGGKQNKQVADNGKINVVTTIFPPYDFVREIAGDKVNVTMLLPPGAESHSFEPSPRDIITVQNCDIFIYGGGESDEWVNRILDSMDTGNMKIIAMMDCVNVVEEEIVEGMEEEEEEDEAEEEPEYDEHVWTSPVNAKLIAGAIADALKQADATNADAYDAGEKEYFAKLDALDASIRTLVAGGKRKTFIFGDRFPFRYFADEYGLSYFAAFPGCSTETECSAATIAFLVDKIRDEKIPAVFYIELSNEKIADTIREETGARKLLLHSVHNVSKKDFGNGATYHSLMTANLANLRTALY